MLNTSFLGLCNTFASVIDQIIAIFAPVFSLLSITNLPTVASICSSLFAA